MAHTTPNGNVSLKPRRGRSFKRARRIDMVARLEAAFIGDIDIAHHLQITVGAVQAIKRSPEFLAKRAALSTGLLSKYDEAFLETQEDQKEELESLVPMALNAVKNVLSDKSHPQYSKVAMEVLDRNAHTSKVSRMLHKVEKPVETPVENQAAAELLALLGSGTEPVPITIEANLQPAEVLNLPETPEVQDVTD